MADRNILLFVVGCLVFGANLTDEGIFRYVRLLFPDGKNILAVVYGRAVIARARTCVKLATFFSDFFQIS